MSTLADETRKSVEEYVTKGTIMVNALLLMCHIFFAVYFKLNHAEIVYYYNVISILIYIAAFDILRRRKAAPYITIVYIEISIFMIVAVMCMGWEFGFQQYCIGIVMSTFFADFYTNKERKIKKLTLLIVFVEVMIYVCLRMWTYSHPHIYAVENEIFIRIFYVANTMVAFLIMVVFCYIYSTTVFQLEASLLNVASVDPMTGLRNRRRMHDLLNTVWEDYKEHPYPICIGMLDVDHFKNINDTYGHDVGDDVLKELAAILLYRHEKERDFHVCRWGGEEFLVLYKHCPEEREKVFEEFDKLRKEIEETVVVSGEGDRIHFTATIGLAFFDGDMSVTEMLKVADNNLYQGKTSGRNVVIWK